MLRKRRCRQSPAERRTPESQKRTSSSFPSILSPFLLLPLLVFLVFFFSSSYSTSPPLSLISEFFCLTRRQQLSSSSSNSPPLQSCISSCSICSISAVRLSSLLSDLRAAGVDSPPLQIDSRCACVCVCMRERERERET